MYQSKDDHARAAGEPVTHTTSKPQKRNNEYHAYVDGSSADGANRYGIGWVITDAKDKNPSEKSKRLPLRKACSMVAEVFAAQDALRHAPDDSVVHIFSDCEAVCDVIATGSYDEKIKKARKNKPLRKAWEALKREAQRHDRVNAFWTQEDQNEHMRTAHQLANMGANKPFPKQEVEGRHLEKHPKRHIQQQLEDSGYDERGTKYDTMDLSL